MTKNSKSDTKSHLAGPYKAYLTITRRKNDFTPTALILRRPITRRKQDFTPTASILRRPNTWRKQHFTPTAQVLRRPFIRRKKYWSTVNFSRNI